MRTYGKKNSENCGDYIMKKLGGCALVIFVFFLVNGIVSPIFQEMARGEDIAGGWESYLIIFWLIVIVSLAIIVGIIKFIIELAKAQEKHKKEEEERRRHREWLNSDEYRKMKEKEDEESRKSAVAMQDLMIKHNTSYSPPSHADIDRAVERMLGGDDD
jgi:uncharacterized membrane protein